MPINQDICLWDLLDGQPRERRKYKVMCAISIMGVGSILKWLAASLQPSLFLSYQCAYPQLPTAALGTNWGLRRNRKDSVGATKGGNLHAFCWLHCSNGVRRLVHFSVALFLFLGKVSQRGLYHTSPALLHSPDISLCPHQTLLISLNHMFYHLPQMAVFMFLAPTDNKNRVGNHALVSFWLIMQI